MSDIQSLQPERTSLLMRALEIVLAESKVGFGDIIRALGDPDTYPEHLLHWPAWERSVEVWDHNWPADVKRAVIKRSIAVHRWKGTRWAVEEALAAIGFEAEIREWFEFEDHEVSPQPGTFTVSNSVSAGGFVPSNTSLAARNARSVIDAAKPLAAHYTFSFEQHATQTVRSAGALLARTFGRKADELNAEVNASVSSSGVIAVQMRQVKPSPMPLRLAARSAGALLCIIREKEVAHAA
ncbi:MULTISPECIES: phage tail protein I [unclassified Phaeobacter]|uniref:phage tail protein I n=1 Tax=unclassified Phaeobacter TaxID=2621772 RepID=UPI003A8B9B1C